MDIQSIQNDHVDVHRKHTQKQHNHYVGVDHTQTRYKEAKRTSSKIQTSHVKVYQHVHTADRVLLDPSFIVRVLIVNLKLQHLRREDYTFAWSSKEVLLCTHVDFQQY